MRLFVRWLHLVGVQPDRWIPWVHIHETADLARQKRGGVTSQQVEGWTVGALVGAGGVLPRPQWHTER